MTTVETRRLTAADVPSCERLLAALPDWFGIEEVNRGYVESLERLPAFVATVEGEVVGFLAIETHAPGSVDDWCRTDQVRWLHVKTRGPSTFDEGYERTRRFYAAMGFEVLYESLTEWGPDDAALVMVKFFGAAGEEG